MPTYRFRDKITGEEVEHFMKIAELDPFREANPHLESIISAPMIVDPVRIGVRKHDNGFKEVLQRVHEKTAGSQLKKTTDI